MTADTAVFVDASPALAAVAERLSADAPFAFRINREPDITADDVPAASSPCRSIIL